MEGGEGREEIPFPGNNESGAGDLHSERGEEFDLRFPNGSDEGSTFLLWENEMNHHECLE